MDVEAEAESPRWDAMAKGGTAMAIALVFTVLAISMIDV